MNIPPLTPIVCSDLTAAAHDPETNNLFIEFKATGRYVYFAVPATVAQELIASARPGKYFLANIKGKYAWDRLP